MINRKEFLSLKPFQMSDFGFQADLSHKYCIIRSILHGGFILFAN
jgi:hypothetical protein